MTNEHFEVHPEGMRELAAEFRTAADEIGGRLQGFTAQAGQIGTAFGLLGACTGVTSQYAEMLLHTEQGIAELAALLQHSGSGLEHSAANYDAVESFTASSMGSRS
ncbi:type VII secretion target [Streptomyces sp. NPDC001793]|uniref:type VII secretion target n=1 Tax=Streptomyces sp. NPDC001793 TaxID=3154657 RepID=UPI00331B884D